MYRVASLSSFPWWVQEGANALGGETSLLVLRVHGAVYCQYLGDRSVVEQSALSRLTGLSPMHRGRGKLGHTSICVAWRGFRVLFNSPVLRVTLGEY